jgi:hypothetical protein
VSVCSKIYSCTGRNYSHRYKDVAGEGAPVYCYTIFSDLFLILYMPLEIAWHTILFTVVDARTMI